MRELLYESTRGAGGKVTASQAILKGLAEDGGLFVPERIPELPFQLEELSGLSYQETAYGIMKEFLTDFTEEELRDCIDRAYDDKFDTKEIAPVRRRTALIIWSCFTALRSPSRIWRFLFCRI